MIFEPIPQKFVLNSAAAALGPIPLTQYVGRGSGAISGSFAQDGTQVNHTFIVPRDWIPAFIGAVLGFSVKSATAGSLSRNLPMECPDFPYLYATRISSFEPLGWDRLADQPIQTLYGPVAPYAFYKMTVVFAGLPFDVFSDDQITPDSATLGEQRRFMEWTDNGSVQIIKREAGTYGWDPAAPCPILTRGTQLTFPAGMPIPRVRQQWKWINVPDDGLYTNGGRSKGGIPGSSTQGLIYAQGCVNNATFMGYPAETLLFDSWTTSPHIQPIDPSYFKTVLMGWPATQALRSWDVTMNFVFYDPNPSYTNTGATYQYHGHNLLPNPQDGFFYKVFQVTSSGPPPVLSATRSLYATADFTKIFRMN